MAIGCAKSLVTGTKIRSVVLCTAETAEGPHVVQAPGNAIGIRCSRRNPIYHFIIVRLLVGNGGQEDFDLFVDGLCSLFYDNRGRIGAIDAVDIGVSALLLAAEFVALARGQDPAIPHNFVDSAGTGSLRTVA